MDQVDPEDLLLRQGQVLHVDDFGQVWAPCRPPSQGPTAAVTRGRLPDATLLHRVLGPPLPGGVLFDRAYWWALQRPGESVPGAWLALRFNGELHLAGFIAYLQSRHLAGAIHVALVALDSGAPREPDPTGDLIVTPATIDGAEVHIGRHRGVLRVSGLALFTATQRDALRYQLSLLPLEREVHVEDDILIVDQFIDHLVHSLVQAGHTAVRMHSPSATTTAELARIRDAMQNEGALFYVDGVAEALTSDLMFDLYEELLFEDE